MVAHDVSHHSVVVFAFEYTGSHVSAVAIPARQLLLDISLDVIDLVLSPDDERVLQVRRNKLSIRACRAYDDVLRMCLCCYGLMQREDRLAIETVGSLYEFMRIAIELVLLVGIEPELLPLRYLSPPVGIDAGFRDVRHSHVQVTVEIDPAIAALIVERQQLV